MDDTNETLQEEQEEALIKVGKDAKTLLQDRVFMDAIQRMSNYFTSAMFLTEPHESKKREGLYHQAISLQAVVDLLAQDVSVAEDILSRREATKESNQ